MSFTKQSFCTHCGAALATGMIFCEQCGEHIVAESPQPASNVPPVAASGVAPVVPPRSGISSTGKHLLTLVAIAAFVGFGVFLFWQKWGVAPPAVATAHHPSASQTPSIQQPEKETVLVIPTPTKPAESTLTPTNESIGVDASRGETVVKLFGAIIEGEVDKVYDCMSPDYRQDVSKASLDAFLRFWVILRQHQSRQFREIFYRKDMATIRGRLMTSDSSGIDIELQLVRDQDLWWTDSIGLLADEQGTFYPQGRTPTFAELTSRSGLQQGRSDDAITWATVVSQKLSPEKVHTLSPERLKYLRNEIFARHGYQFPPGNLNDHFQKQPWYRPTSTDQSAVGAELSVLEHENLLIVIAEEGSRRP
jgi:hypothetical protein